MNHVAPEEIATILYSVMHPDIAWHGPHPLNTINGIDNLATGFWRSLRTAFPDLKRTCDIFIGGESAGDDGVTATGYFTGTFHDDWQLAQETIPATGQKTYIRFGQFCVMDNGKMTESPLILDLLAVLRQASFQLLPPARGAEGGRVPPPRPPSAGAGRVRIASNAPTCNGDGCWYAPL